MKRHLIKDIFLENPLESTIMVAGWVRSLRKSKNFSFLILNDGSCQENLQIVMDQSMEGYEAASSLLTGSCVQIVGKVVKSQGKGQSLEMQAHRVEVIGPVTQEYPLQKKASRLEFLRDHAHLRPRTNLFGAIFRIRHRLAMATHQFFDDRGFYYLNAPILTSIDAEGAGETFKVTALDLENLPTGKLSYESDYFGKIASLSVSGQLEAECFALGMNRVYTFGPTFRAENSNTPRHLAEFWMVEPEVAFMDLEGIGELAADYLKYMIDTVLQQCPSEMEALIAYHKYASKQKGIPYNNHIDVLEKISKASFEKITYTKALELCRTSSKKFEFGVEWGTELQTEHERYLAEEVFKVPVIVTDYPKNIKAFYMKQNDDDKTVRAMDVLVPGVGEIIGGSQREDNLDRLQQRMSELKMEQEPLWWYLDLRRFGSAPHSGFGLGFERAVLYITGMKNIRDVVPFPRTPKDCRF